MTEQEPENRPRPDTALAVLGLLHDQLRMVTDSADSIDRRAALLPPFLGGAAGLLLTPVPAPFAPAQCAFIAVALVSGALAGYHAITALVTRPTVLGPNAQELAAALLQPLTDVYSAACERLADAVTHRAEANKAKGASFNWAVRLSGIAILSLAISRVIGGLQ